jgi:hypothetical protein
MVDVAKNGTQHSGVVAKKESVTNDISNTMNSPGAGRKFNCHSLEQAES